MNKQSSKNSMLFNLVPSYTASVESSSQLRKKHRKRKLAVDLVDQISTNNSNGNNVIFKGNLVGKDTLKVLEVESSGFGKVVHSDRLHNPSRSKANQSSSEKKTGSAIAKSKASKKRQDSNGKYKQVLNLGLARRK